MNISIIGTGYVGLVTGTCLADFGLSVTCVDQDETKISLLNKESKVIFIAVGTPSNDDGSANLIQIEEVAQQIAFLDDDETINSSMEIDVIGKSSDAFKYVSECDIFVAIGNNKTREKTQN